MTMKKIIITTQCVVNGKNRKINEIVEVTASDRNTLVGYRLANDYEAPIKEVKPSKAEIKAAEAAAEAAAKAAAKAAAEAAAEADENGEAGESDENGEAGESDENGEVGESDENGEAGESDENGEAGESGNPKETELKINKSKK